MVAIGTIFTTGSLPLQVHGNRVLLGAFGEDQPGGLKCILGASRFIAVVELYAAAEMRSVHLERHFCGCFQCMLGAYYCTALLELEANVEMLTGCGWQTCKRALELVADAQPVAKIYCPCTQIFSKHAQIFLFQLNVSKCQKNKNRVFLGEIFL